MLTFLYFHEFNIDMKIELTFSYIVENSRNIKNSKQQNITNINII